MTQDGSAPRSTKAPSVRIRGLTASAPTKPKFDPKDFAKLPPAEKGRKIAALFVRNMNEPGKKESF